ncbi:MAG: hypothetical protein ACXQTY_00020 [Candidatus Methanogasteraceae archaeon]
MAFAIIRECAASAKPSLDVDFVTNRVNRRKTLGFVGGVLQKYSSAEMIFGG